jgi:hypothetical protein
VAILSYSPPFPLILNVRLSRLSDYCPKDLISFVSQFHYCIIMFKPSSQFNDTKTVRHPVFAIKRKSESDDSSDYRSSLESPTTHCYIAGTRPRRTLPRRALSTGRVDINSAALCVDVQSGKLLQTGLRKPHMTPPRSKSATSFRTFDRIDPILPIPNIGTRRIYTRM